MALDGLNLASKSISSSKSILNTGFLTLLFCDLAVIDFHESGKMIEMIINNDTYMLNIEKFRVNQLMI